MTHNYNITIKKQECFADKLSAIKQCVSEIKVYYIKNDDCDNNMEDPGAMGFCTRRIGRERQQILQPQAIGNYNHFIGTTFHFFFSLFYVLREYIIFFMQKKQNNINSPF